MKVSGFGNLHTHTVFCDGADTPEELVQYALSQNCSYIGFSGHSSIDIPGSDSWCMTRENTAHYKEEIRRMKRVYGDRIQILLGIEQDYFSEEETSEYDYVIGSVHYVRKDDVYIPVDESRETQVNAVNQYYNGDFYAFAEDYYVLVADVYRRTRCDIVGHFDLITKFNEGNSLFDTAHPRYVRASNAALDSLLMENVIFEKNYGAIARGYRKTPYPDDRITDRILSAGREMICTSDCHRKEQLLLGL